MPDEAKMKSWRESWIRLRSDMAQIADLRWLSLTAAQGETEVNDFMDLGHMTPQGQSRLANAVAEKLLASGGWFGPETLGKK